MRAAVLDRRITILRGTETDDGFQTVRGDPAAVAGLTNIAASAVPVRDGERFAGGEMQASLTYRFTVRYSSATAAIEETDLVQYEGKTFGIASVKELGRREGIEITATGRAEG